jgi:hypothetical protein
MDDHLFALGYLTVPQRNTSSSVSRVRASDLQDIEPECSICLEQFDASSMVTKCPCPCKVAYHVDCLRRWLEQHHRACPWCRYSIGQIPNGIAFSAIKGQSAKELQLLAEVKANPTLETLKKAIEEKYPAIVKLLIQAGVSPRIHHLALAKLGYAKTKDNLFKQIGKMLIKCLRLTQPIGCQSSGPLSKQGIVGIYDIPAELAEHIATFILE